MIISKKFNNNAVMVNEDGNEIVLMGNGLGFGVSKGDEIDKNKIEKTFLLNDNNYNIISNTLSEVPDKYISLTKEIVAISEKELDIKLNEYLFLTLSDHIYHAILRNNDGINIANPLGNEIKRIYPKEYSVSKKIVDYIFEKENIVFDDDEATFITLHLVNGQQNMLSKPFESQAVARMVRDILKIVEFHYSIELNKHNVYYDRFIIHLKTFIERTLSDDYVMDNETTNPIFDDLKNKDIRAYECVKKIVSYIKKKENIDVSEDEKFYLFVYLYRITTK